MRKSRPGSGVNLSLEGAVETSNEVFAVMKTERPRYDALERRLRELHPYEVPECIMLRVREGLPDYLRWITESILES